MTTALFARRFLTEAARNPVNVMMLVLVPVVFVVVAAAAMQDAARALDYREAPTAHLATVGWAAGFITATAMYFQIRAARATDRRVVLAGLAPARLVAARMATGLALALVAAAAAVLTLAARTSVADPGRIVAGTVMYAVIYLAVGALVGALASDPVNGTVLILFVWILDVVFGPAYGSADRLGTRLLPTHYVTLWMMDRPSHHAGPLGDLGWSLVWTLAALAVAWAVITRVTRLARPPRHPAAPAGGPIAGPSPQDRPAPPHAGSGAAGPPGAPSRRRTGQLATGTRMGMREAARNRPLWGLLLVVPAVFVWLAAVTSLDEFAVITVREGGREVPARFWLPDIHGGIMAPIAIASLAAIAGLFTVLDARSGDRRLVLAGFRPGRLLLSRLAVIVLLALLATAASLAVTATVFHARQWGLYAAANTLIALTYALVGVLIGPLFGRVAGVFVAFLVPFIDLGIEQSPVIHPRLSGWSEALPGYGGSRVLFDAALTPTFDDTGAVLIALAWIAALACAVVLIFRRTCAPPGTAGVNGAPGG